MIADTNSIFEFGFQTLLGASGGSWIILGLLVLLVIAIALVLGKVKIGTAIVSGVCIIFIFSIFDQSFLFLFWLAVIIAGITILNGLRKYYTGG